MPTVSVPHRGIAGPHVGPAGRAGCRSDRRAAERDRTAVHGDSRAARLDRVVARLERSSRVPARAGHDARSACAHAAHAPRHGYGLRARVATGPGSGDRGARRGGGARRVVGVATTRGDDGVPVAGRRPREPSRRSGLARDRGPGVRLDVPPLPLLAPSRGRSWTRWAGACRTTRYGRWCRRRPSRPASRPSPTGRCTAPSPSTWTRTPTSACSTTTARRSASAARSTSTTSGRAARGGRGCSREYERAPAGVSGSTGSTWTRTGHPHEAVGGRRRADPVRGRSTRA